MYCRACLSGKGVGEGGEKGVCWFRVASLQKRGPGRNGELIPKVRGSTIMQQDRQPIGVVAHRITE